MYIICTNNIKLKKAQSSVSLSRQLLNFTRN